MSNCPFKHLLVLDFETTSEKDDYDYAREVIQLAVAVIEVKSNKILDELSFNEFVRPERNPILTEYCSELTGITQEQVDAADTFRDVYNRFCKWLEKNGFVKKTFAFVTDCRHDMWHIAQYQFCLIKKPLPSMFRQWINIKRIFDNGLQDGERDKLIGSTNIERMANHLGIKATGRAHDALSDCTTLAQITQKILQTGCLVTINETLCCSALWRKEPLDMELCSEWRTDFRMSMKVKERILPLVVKLVRDYDIKNYGICSYCRDGPPSCGSRHRQFPRELYQSLQKPSVFARTADYY